MVGAVRGLLRVRFAVVPAARHALPGGNHRAAGDCFESSYVLDRVCRAIRRGRDHQFVAGNRRPLCRGRLHDGVRTVLGGTTGVGAVALAHRAAVLEKVY